LALSIPVPLPDYYVSSLPVKFPPGRFPRGRGNPIPRRPKSINATITMPPKLYFPLGNITVPSQDLPPAGTPTNITLSASGHLNPIRPSVHSISALSAFMSSYLSGESYPVLVTVDLPIVTSPGTGPGELIDPSQTLSFEATFPAANPKPHLLQDLTIRDMKIRYGAAPPNASGESSQPPQRRQGPLPMPIAEHANDYTILASGTVWARVVLPREIDVEASVTRVWPDILLYDGLPEDGAEGRPQMQLPPSPAGRVWRSFKTKEEALAARPLPWEDAPVCYRRDPEKAPLPEPLPENAFARLRPSEWIVAQSEPGRAEDGRRETVVQAKIEDVAVVVLPGRESRMRSFMSKAIFSRNGAEAGINGITAVAIIMDGLVAPPPSQDDDALLVEYDMREIELHGLPIDGSVRVGGKLM